MNLDVIKPSAEPTYNLVVMAKVYEKVTGGQFYAEKMEWQLGRDFYRYFHNLPMQDFAVASFVSRNFRDYTLCGLEIRQNYILPPQYAALVFRDRAYHWILLQEQD